MLMGVRMFNTPCVALVLLSVSAFSQAPPAFEVADVKANKSGETRMAVDMQPGGKLVMHNVPMRVLIMFAYHLRAEAVSGPAWLDSERYDVIAKAAQTSVPDDLRRMLQTLLTERFKLGVHTEQKPMPVYALVLGKSGAKLQRSEAAILSEQRCVPAEGVAGQKHVMCRHMTMAVLADNLQELSPRDFPIPVIDQTGLSGPFDFKLDWTPAARLPVADTEPAPGLTVFQAVEAQLGLKLESRKLPLPVIVVDHVERVPVEN
jgi:uncharacterized protein (TIGR03435 family)